MNPPLGARGGSQGKAINDVDAVIAYFDSRYQQLPLVATGTITYIDPDENGLPKSAKATINGKPNKMVRVGVGSLSNIHVGGQYVFHTTDGPIGQMWDAVSEVTTNVEAISGQTISDIKPLIVPTAENGGVFSERYGDPATLPGGPVSARAYLFYRSIFPGQYSVFKNKITAIKGQIRESGDTEWVQTITPVLYPDVPVRLLLAQDIDDNDLQFNVTIPTEFANKVLVDQPAWWRIGGEYMRAVLGSGELVAYPANTLTVVTHNGSDNATLGLGFVQALTGRGLTPGVSAVAHANGDRIELQSGQITFDNLKPDTSYEVQLAAVRDGLTGQFSNIVTFTSWKQTETPLAVSGLNVYQRKGNKLAEWTKLTRRDIDEYIVYKSPVTGTSTTVPGAAVEFGRTRADNIVIPDVFGTGNWIGIRAVDTTGNPGFISWAQDNVPPPHPDPSYWAIHATVDGPNVLIGPEMYGSGQAGADPGFLEFRVYRSNANNIAGAGAVDGRNDSTFGNDPNNNLTLVKVLGKVTSAPIEGDDPTSTQYYQLTAVDYAGNETLCVGAGTHWKRDNGQPADMAAPTVNAIQAGFGISWTVPSAVARAGIRYIEVKRTSDGAGGLNVNTKLVSSDTDSLTWGLMDVINPNVAKDCVYFFIRPVDYNGNPSANWSAAGSDTTAPSAPSSSNVLLQSVDFGCRVIIAESEVANSKRNPNFKEFVLRARTVGGGGEFNAKRFTDHQEFYEFIPGRSLDFQVVSADWVENQTADNPANWRTIKSVYPRADTPINGNFEKDNGTTGNLLPYWSTNILPGGFGGAAMDVSFSWQQTGGARGSRCIKLIKNSASAFTQAGLYTVPQVPVDPSRSFYIKISMMWVVAGLPKNITARIGFIITDSAESVTGGTILGYMGFSNNAIRFANQWDTCIFGPYTLNSLAGAGSTARAMHLYIWGDQGLGPAGEYVLIDNVELVYLV